jgi:hypothetical protein
MTVKSVPHRCKQNVRSERFEQMRAPTRDQANVLLWVTRHFDDRCANIVRKDSDINTTAIWQYAVDERHIYMRCSQGLPALLPLSVLSLRGTTFRASSGEHPEQTVHPRQSRRGNRTPFVPFAPVLVYK